MLHLRKMPVIEVLTWCLILPHCAFQMEHLKACAEIATQRTVNWQKFCIKDDCEFFPGE